LQGPEIATAGEAAAVKSTHEITPASCPATLSMPPVQPEVGTLPKLVNFTTKLLLPNFCLQLIEGVQVLIHLFKLFEKSSLGS